MLFKIYLGFSILTFIMVELTAYELGEEHDIKLKWASASMLRMLIYSFIPILNLSILYITLFQKDRIKLNLPRGGVK